MKFTWHHISTVEEATKSECLYGLWFYESEYGGFSFIPFFKGYWKIPSSLTYWAYGDRPNKPEPKPEGQPEPKLTLFLESNSSESEWYLYDAMFTDRNLVRSFQTSNAAADWCAANGHTCIQA